MSYRNDVHMVSAQAPRGTASRWDTQILPLNVFLLPRMARTQPEHTSIGHKIKHIHSLFSKYYGIINNNRRSSLECNTVLKMAEQRSQRSYRCHITDKYNTLLITTKTQTSNAAWF
jgi:hypothetical protein